MSEDANLKTHVVNWWSGVDILNDERVFFLFSLAGPAVFWSGQSRELADFTYRRPKIGFSCETVSLILM